MNQHTRSERGIFERPEKTFEFDPRALQWIMDDNANPLNRIVRIIPDGATVLDVGAGNGILARLLRHVGRNVSIDAVEPDPVAKTSAAPHYRSIFSGSVEEFIEASGGRSQSYDFIVMADVIEHIANPAPLLDQLKTLLSPGGNIVISTPNIAFASVRLALLNGRFDYVESGILERTHLRFYTLKSLRALLAAVGLHTHAQYHCLRDPRRTEIAINDLPMVSFMLRVLSKDELSRVYQFLFVLGTSPGKTFVREDLRACTATRSGRLRSLLKRLLGKG